MSVTGSRITFGPDAMCPDEKLPAGKGTYPFSLKGKTLRFTKIKDGNNCRAVTLTAHPWTRQ